MRKESIRDLATLAAFLSQGLYSGCIPLMKPQLLLDSLFTYSIFCIPANSSSPGTCEPKGGLIAFYSY